MTGVFQGTKLAQKKHGVFFL